MRGAAEHGRYELASGAALVGVGVAIRWWLACRFPTRPVSDFAHLVELARLLATAPGVPATWHWEYFNPGLPNALALVLRVVPGAPEEVARLATATLCGALGLLPFVLWRGVVSRSGRWAAALGLSLWPGQALFSGVVAQDNWVLPPVVAVLALAVRAARTRRGAPVAAGLAFALAAATRQETLVVLLPAALVAAGVAARPGRWRRLAVFAAGAAAVLVPCAAQRAAATGEWSLLTAHSGTTVLSAWAPGSTENHWVDPVAYAASVRPDLVRDPEGLRAEAWSLVAGEARRRPGFHALRIAAWSLRFAVDSEGDNLHWSLLAPGVLPAGTVRLGEAVARTARPALRLEMAGVLTGGLAALLLGLPRRDPAILAVASFVVLKAGLHVVTMAQGRYFLAVSAAGWLLAGLAVEASAGGGPSGAGRPRVVRVWAAAAAVAVAVLAAAPTVEAAVRRFDVVGQPTYRFEIVSGSGGSRLSCRVATGHVLVVEPDGFLFRPVERDPSPGEGAVASCRLAVAPGVAPLVEVEDAYAAGDHPGRMLQSVEVEGSEVWRHDLGAIAWSGWSPVALGLPPAGASRQVRVTIEALRPDPGAAWGPASATRVRLRDTAAAAAPADLGGGAAEEAPAGAQGADLRAPVAAFAIHHRQHAERQTEAAGAQELVELREAIEIVGEGADLDHPQVVLPPRPLEPAEGIAQSAARQGAEQPREDEVAQAAQEAHAPGRREVESVADDEDVASFAQGRDEWEELGGGDLAVGVEDEHDVAGGPPQPLDDRLLLAAAGLAEHHDPVAPGERGEPEQLLEGAVGRAALDEEELEGAAVERIELPKQVFETAALVAQRHDQRHGGLARHAGRSGPASASAVRARPSSRSMRGLQPRSRRARSAEIRSRGMSPGRGGSRRGRFAGLPSSTASRR